MKKVKRVSNFVIALLFSLCLVLTCFPITGYTKKGSNDKNGIVVSMGDSFSSGEGIEDFYGQDKRKKDMVKDQDFLAHRSKQSWPGKLDIEGIGLLSDAKDDRWFFVASSGAVTDSIYHKQN